MVFMNIRYQAILSVVVILLCVFALSGCIHQMPSTLEVAAHGVKTVYNKCSDLDNWQCLWYDN